MKLLKSILVAVDFTDSSDNVLKNSIRFAKTFKSRITLIHVLPDDINNKKVSDLLEKTVNTKLNALNERIVKEGLEAGPPILEHGNHCDKIVRTSEKIGANLIMIGSGNKLAGDAFQLGSTAEKMIRKSNQPVFVIKNGDTLSLKNIVCPVDFSKESSRALNSAIIIARMVGAKLTVLSVYPPFRYDSIEFNMAEINELRQKEYRQEFKKYMEGFNLIDLDYDQHILGGKPSEEILKLIKKENADLLIMGTTGKSGISKILMGSVTEKVVREVPCSFITVKNEDVVAFELESKIQDIENHYDLAQKLFSKGFYEESIQQYKVCLNLNIMHVPALMGIAKAYQKVGDSENAIKHNSMANRILERIENMKIEQEVRQQINR